MNNENDEQSTRVERFKKPTDEQVVKAAILFNNGTLTFSKLADMVALCNWVINRLYENGDISIPTLNENQNEIS